MNNKEKNKGAQHLLSHPPSCCRYGIEVRPEMLLAALSRLDICWSYYFAACPRRANGTECCIVINWAPRAVAPAVYKTLALLFSGAEGRSLNH